MSTSHRPKWSGLAAVLGGVLWIAQNVALAFAPEGCIAAECDLPGRSYREASSGLVVLGLAAVLLIAGGFVGVVRLARRAGRFRRLGHTGLGLSITGVALIAFAIVIQLIVFGGERGFQLWPWFVVPGGLALVLGCLLLGIAILRAQVLPRWVAVLLIIGVLAMLGFNDQNERVLLAVPFGLAWIAVGYVLWSGRHEATHLPGGS